MAQRFLRVMPGFQDQLIDRTEIPHYFVGSCIRPNPLHFQGLIVHCAYLHMV